MLAFSTNCLPRFFTVILIYTSPVPPEVKHFHLLICCLSIFFGGLSIVRFYLFLKLKNGILVVTEFLEPFRVFTTLKVFVELLDE